MSGRGASWVESGSKPLAATALLDEWSYNRVHHRRGSGARSRSRDRLIDRWYWQFPPGKACNGSWQAFPAFVQPAEDVRQRGAADASVFRASRLPANHARRHGGDPRFHRLPDRGGWASRASRAANHTVGTPGTVELSIETVPACGQPKNPTPQRS